MPQCICSRRLRTHMHTQIKRPLQFETSGTVSHQVEILSLHIIYAEEIAIP